MNDPIDWPSLVFDESATKRFASMAERRFTNSALAEESVTFALEALSRDNWEILRRHEGVSSPEGYLFTTFRRLLEDFHRAKFGRIRPPSWIKKLGGLWEKLFRFLCLERLSFEEIAQRFRSVDTPGMSSADEIYRAISLIKGKVPNCGEYRVEAETGDKLIDHAEAVDNGLTPEAVMSSNEQEEVLAGLGFLMGDGNKMNPVASPEFSRLSETILSVPLSDDDRICLRLVFQQGYSVSETARMLHEKDHKVRRQIKGILEQLKASLLDNGLDLESIMTEAS